MTRRYSLPLSAVKNVTYKCQHCRERAPIPVKFPQAALHDNRLKAWTYAFHDTGMDHFGPFEVQRAKKVWGLLLICLTTGAVHLEPVDTLSVTSHLNALDRFIARRGKPKRIRSDKGRTFVGGAKEYQELTKILGEQNFQGELAKEAKKRWGIEFVFNVEYTPQHGGRWERMVKEFKRSLSKAVDSTAKLTYDALATLLIRAEGIINQRPIAIDDDLRVITPMQLLQPASGAAFGFKVGQSIPRIHEQVRQTVDYFWRHWRSLYLTQLTAERLAKGNAKFFNLAVGDKVLLKDNFKSPNVFARPDWVPVKVTDVFPSHDGAVRTVTVQREDGDQLTLTTDKLAIVEEDLLNRYRQQQGLQTVVRDTNVKVVTATPDDDESKLVDQAVPLTVHGMEKAGQAGPSTATPVHDKSELPDQAGPSTAQTRDEGKAVTTTAATPTATTPTAAMPTAGAVTPTAETTTAGVNTSTRGRHGRPKGAKNRRWQGDAKRYSLRSRPMKDDEND
jgi:hypothetical protein